MFGAYTVQQIRDAGARAMAGRPELELMLRAATGLAHATARELKRRRCRVPGAHLLVLAGAGNNGGDALFAAAALAARGVGVRAWRVFGKAHPQGWEALIRAGGREVSAADVPAVLRWADLVMDGVFGIGGRPGLPPELAEFADANAGPGVPIVAVDLPSGLDADSGLPGPPSPAPRGDAGPVVTTGAESQAAPADSVPDHLESALCVTFGARKLCHVLQPAATACGQVEVIDIGLELPEPELACWEPKDVAAAWPVPGPQSHKYTRGVVRVDAGSATYQGAGVLATLGAVWSGAGMVRFVGPEPGGVRAAAPNVVVGDGRVQAEVLGPGWGDRPDGAQEVVQALTRTEKLVIDADALRYLPVLLRPGVVLTPHAGELAGLLSVSRAQVESDPIGASRTAARRFSAVVLLKGAVQVVAEPSGRVQIAVPGPAWTAQAGSGDVLAGVIGTLLAAGLPPATAAVCGASLQAMTAAVLPGPVPPQELARHFPGVIAGLTECLMVSSAPVSARGSDFTPACPAGKVRGARKQ